MNSAVTVCVQGRIQDSPSGRSAKIFQKKALNREICDHGRLVALPRSVTGVDDWKTELFQFVLVLSLIFGYVLFIIGQRNG